MISTFFATCAIPMAFIAGTPFYRASRLGSADLAVNPGLRFPYQVRKNAIRLDPERQSMLIIFCVFLVIIGIVFAAFPQNIYDCLERWKTIGDNGPSNI